MNRFASFYCFLLLLLLASVSYTQNSNDKVKAALSDMPSQMKAGETTVITVTITNIGAATWSNADITARELGVFDITKVSDVLWSIEPGQSRDIQYRVTAPQKPGKYKMRVVVYNGSKKVGSKNKTVTVE